MPAKYLRGAESYGCCGGSAFGFAAFMNAAFCGTTQDEFQLSIDDQPFETPISTVSMLISNGSYVGGKRVNPFASVNDGLMDLTWISDPAWQGYSGVKTIMKGAYEDRNLFKGASKYARGRRV